MSACLPHPPFSAVHQVSALCCAVVWLCGSRSQRHNSSVDAQSFQRSRKRQAFYHQYLPRLLNRSATFYDKNSQINELRRMHLNILWWRCPSISRTAKWNSKIYIKLSMFSTYAFKCSIFTVRLKGGKIIYICGLCNGVASSWLYIQSQTKCLHILGAHNLHVNRDRITVFCI